MKSASAANLEAMRPLGSEYLRISKADWAARTEEKQAIFQFRGLRFRIMAATITSNGNLMPPIEVMHFIAPVD